MSLTIEQAVSAVEDNLFHEPLADFGIEVDETIAVLGVLEATVYVGNTDEEAGRVRITVEVIES